MDEVYTNAEMHFENVKMLTRLGYISYYASMKEGCVYRDWLENTPQGKLLIDLEVLNHWQDEQRVLSAIIVHSLITIEAAVNFVIAHKFENRAIVINCIENPKELTKGVISQIPTDGGDLAHKLALLDGSSVANQTIMNAARALSKERNAIVHDKPFILHDDRDGVMDTEPLAKRGSSDDRLIHSFSQFDDWISHCDVIMKFITNHAHGYGYRDYLEDIDFSVLVSQDYKSSIQGEISDTT
jgi:hypothetical protein